MPSRPMRAQIRLVLGLTRVYAFVRFRDFLIEPFDVGRDLCRCHSCSLLIPPAGYFFRPTGILFVVRGAAQSRCSIQVLNSLIRVMLLRFTEQIYLALRTPPATAALW